MIVLFITSYDFLACMLILDAESDIERKISDAYQGVRLFFVFICSHKGSSLYGI